jgi:hypothetical protein
MFAFAGPSAGDDLAGNCDPETAPYGEAGIARSDSDNAVVIAYVKQLVDEGKAAWRRLPMAISNCASHPESSFFLAKKTSRGSARPKQTSAG